MKRILKSIFLSFCILAIPMNSYASTVDLDKDLTKKVIIDLGIYEKYNVDSEVMNILRKAEECLEVDRELSIKELDKYVMDAVIKEKKKTDGSYYLNSTLDYTDYLPITEGTLNEKEKELFNEHPIYGALVLADAKVAIERTSDLWEKDYGYHNDNADAFRHSYWNGLMTYHTTESFAEDFANAHEEGTPNPPLEASMDYYNNSKGRNIVANTRYPNFPNGMMAFSAIEEDILDDIKDGEMKRYEGIDIGTKSDLVKTNSAGLK